MSGITQDEARIALKCGWEQTKLVNLHHYLTDSDLSIVSGRIREWGVFLNDYTIYYKNSFLKDYKINLESSLDYKAVCYADGSGTTSDKTAGIGVWIEDSERAPRYIAECIGDATNNRAELIALWRALREFPNTKKKMLINSDSEYAMGACQNNWVKNKNIKLINAIKEDLEWRSGNIEFRHVDGHSGVHQNETVDWLANIGRKFVPNVTDYGCRD